MLQMRLASGAPDEPDTGDWDPICETPGPRTLFATLFREIAGGLPNRRPPWSARTMLTAFTPSGSAATRSGLR